MNQAEREKLYPEFKIWWYKKYPFFASDIYGAIDMWFEFLKETGRDGNKGTTNKRSSKVSNRKI